MRVARGARQRSFYLAVSGAPRLLCPQTPPQRWAAGCFGQVCARVDVGREQLRNLTRNVGLQRGVCLATPQADLAPR
ncbi:hypothetical protein NK8_83470 (plasmid) [Caballeronia sp. NK8]|nr:hypothetical protein NK8_83470 [Caballeronia sp. NK8]